MSASRVISLIGLPGAGKTTIGKALALYMGHKCTYFGVGEVLREKALREPSLQRQLDEGELGPEAVVAQLVSEAYSLCTTEAFILDGFPRHPGQVAFARKTFVQWKVLCLGVTRDSAVARLLARRSCADCGAPSQGIEHSDQCQRCGGRTWETRAEDASAILQQRLDSAQEDLQGLLAAISGSIDITILDGNVAANEVLDGTLKIIL